MADQANLKEVMERGIATLRENPSLGRGTATTNVTIRSGVTCDVTDGRWKLVGDEEVGDGGAGLGPDPGVFVRAGLGTCLAMGYVQRRAARRADRQRARDDRGGLRRERDDGDR